MIPRLIGVSGIASGIEVNLERTVTIGRHSDNDVSIDDLSASRYHCSVVREESTWFVVDADSANGTSLNGEPVTDKRILSNGDRITVGNSVFWFAADAEQTVTITAMVDRRTCHPTAILSQDQVRSVDSEAVMRSLPAGERAKRSLHALLGIGKLLVSVGSVSSVQFDLFALIAETVPVERGAIVLPGYSDREPKVSFIWERNNGSDSNSVHVSRTIVDRVIREGIALLAVGPQVNEIIASESLIARRVAGILCVPLVIHNVVHGAIYLECTDAAAPFDERDLQLLTAIAGYGALALDHARRTELLEKENLRLRSHVRMQHTMIGDSAAMQELYERIRKLAQTDASVLITGESGTGKELTARALHINSQRSAAPFEATNCALLREDLIESELFGHEKGSFTGAISQKRGRLELAHGGTVFLDEIGELPEKTQAMLLRVLQEREFMRVGATKPIRVDIRLLAATNRDLEQAVRDNAFREDLFYRLGVICLRLPPLRDRRDDIPLLAHHFMRRSAQRNKKPVSAISPPAMALLMSHSWPGNIRELENTMEYAAVFASSDEILPEDLPDAIHAGPNDARSTSNYHKAVRQAREGIILNSMRRAGYNYSGAAKLLGIHVNNLHRLIRELNIKHLIPPQVQS